MPQEKPTLPAVAASSVPAVPDSPSSPYAPGALRAETDAQRAAVDAFVRDNPACAGLPFDVLTQTMDRRSGYRSDEERRERAILADEGVAPLAAGALDDDVENMEEGA